MSSFFKNSNLRCSLSSIDAFIMSKSKARHKFQSLGIIIFLVLGIQNICYGLQPAHEADRLIMAAEEAIDNNDYRDAEKYLIQAGTLGIELPSEYDFLYGKLLQHNGEYAKANEQLEKYVSRDGNEGRYYRQALSLITEIEKKSDNKNTTNISAPTSEIKWSDDSNSYLSSLRKKYGEKDSRSALVSHINKLLDQYAYGDEKILAASRMGPQSRHNIRMSQSGEIVSMNKFGAEKQTPFKEDRFSVYGINPYVDVECTSATSSCWIIHPVTQKRWLQISDNKDAAAELAKALTQLIRLSQKNG